MNIKLSEVDWQSWATIWVDFVICESCQRVSRDLRVMEGVCANCGEKNRTNILYFDTVVTRLVEMIQVFHFSDTARGEDGTIFVRGDTKRLGMIITFCTLGEVLLEKFLVSVMNKQGISKQIKARLLNDHRFIKERVDKLFPALTQEKWKLVLKDMTKPGELDYVEIDGFYKKAQLLRNTFLHSGILQKHTEKVSVMCIDNIWGILNMFVAL